MFKTSAVVLMLVAVGGIFAACGGASDGLSADSVLAAFEESGVSVPEPRDNTHNYTDLGVEKQVTTEAVSIFEFPTEEAAAAFYSEGVPEGEGYQAGRIVIRFNESADGEYKPEPSEEAYIAVLDALVAGAPVPTAPSQ